MTVEEYRQAYWDASKALDDFGKRNIEGDFDDMEDEAFDELLQSYTRRKADAYMAWYDAGIKGIRPNEWYKKFLDSFGGDGVCQSVSDRQADQFLRRMQHDDRRDVYLFRYNGLVYQLSRHGYQPKYILKIRKEYC